MDYKKVVEYCVRRLVADPEAVNVASGRERGAIQVVVRVAPEDVGKVIGRNGRVINALRHYVNAIGGKRKEKVYVKVVA